jgi:hypothetical protein
VTNRKNQCSGDERGLHGDPEPEARCAGKSEQEGLHREAVEAGPVDRPCLAEGDAQVSAGVGEDERKAVEKAAQSRSSEAAAIRPYSWSR